MNFKNLESYNSTDFDLKEKHKLLGKINEALDAHMYEQDHIGFLVGKSGTAVFKFMYAALLDDEKSYDEAIELILNCNEAIENGYSNASYCTGIAGYLWSIDFIDSNNYCDIEVEENMKMLNPFLHNTMMFLLENGNYDLLQGALGYAVVFLRRFQNTKDMVLKKTYYTYIEDFIVELRKHAIYEQDTIKWSRKLKPEDTVRENYYDIGLAHGIPSILAYLRWVDECPGLEINVTDLIFGIIKYIEKIENDEGEISHFPNELTAKTSSKISRVAWCYGDLGVGQVLLQCGKHLSNTEITDWGIKALLSAANRTGHEEHLVHDACICHGSFGNAMIFKQAYDSTGQPNFLQAYNRWMNLGFAMGNDESGYAGYKFFMGGSKKWKNELSVLEGITGIGLVLMEDIMKKSNGWSKSLLID